MAEEVRALLQPYWLGIGNIVYVCMWVQQTARNQGFSCGGRNEKWRSAL